MRRWLRPEPEKVLRRISLLMARAGAHALSVQEDQIWVWFTEEEFIDISLDIDGVRVTSIIREKMRPE